jgi:hypothetical protein
MPSSYSPAQQVRLRNVYGTIPRRSL